MYIYTKPHSVSSLYNYVNHIIVSHLAALLVPMCRGLVTDGVLVNAEVWVWVWSMLKIRKYIKNVH